MKRTVTLALLLAVAVTTFAMPGGMRPGRNDQSGRRPGAQGRLGPRQLAEFLDLSQAQQDQAKALHESMRTTIEPLRDQARANREAVKAAVDAGDAQKAGQLLVAGKATREQIKSAHDSFQAKFEALLTAEQKSKWAVAKELRESRRPRHD
jgi:Spy/CpxP family protein refolding chaperone